MSWYENSKQLNRFSGLVVSGPESLQSMKQTLLENFCITKRLTCYCQRDRFKSDTFRISSQIFCHQVRLTHRVNLKKNVSGLSPLQCAAERARASVVEILASRPEVSRAQAIEAYELLGASFANDKEFYCIRVRTIFVCNDINSHLYYASCEYVRRT